MRTFLICESARILSNDCAVKWRDAGNKEYVKTVVLPQFKFVGVVGDIALVAGRRDSRRLVYFQARITGIAVQLAVASVSQKRVATAGLVMHFLFVLDESARLDLRRCHKINFLDQTDGFLEEIDNRNC